VHLDVLDVGRGLYGARPVNLEITDRGQTGVSAIDHPSDEARSHGSIKEY
jgi:hypothetical protein